MFSILTKATLEVFGKRLYNVASIARHLYHFWSIGLVDVQEETSINGAVFDEEFDQSFFQSFLFGRAICVTSVRTAEPKNNHDQPCILRKAKESTQESSHASVTQFSPLEYCERNHHHVSQPGSFLYFNDQIPLKDFS